MTVKSESCCSDSEKEDEVEKAWYECLIISVDNPFKSNFDILILFLVAYSCFASLYSVAFSEPTNPIHRAWDQVVDFCFYIEIVLNFFHAVKDPDSQGTIDTFKGIAINYLTTWFPIDFVSVFPFYLFIPTGVMTKLFRLFRLPRLLKILDVNRFNRVL